MPDSLLEQHRLRSANGDSVPFPPARGWRPGLRFYLFAILLTALLPALVAGAISVLNAADAYRAAYAGRLRDTARAFALAMDAQIAGRVATLNAFAASPAFDDGRLGADAGVAHLHAGRVAAATGMRIAVADGTGKMLLHHEVPPGMPLPERGAAGEVLRQALAEQRPVVSGFIVGAVTRRPIVLLAVPIPRADGGPPLLVATGALDPETFDAVLAAQGMEQGAAAALVSAAGTIIARSDGRYRGLILPREAVVSVTDSSAGLYRRRMPDGEGRVFAAAPLRAVPGWSVAVSAPYAAYHASWARPLLGTVAGTALGLAVSGWLALRLARRLLRPVRRLAAHARAIALDPEASHGMAADLPPAPVAELEALRHGLAAAEEALARRRAAERAAYVVLAEKEAMLATSQQLAGLGSWTIELCDPEDLAGCPLRWTEETFRIFGLMPGSVTVSMPMFFAAVPPADRARIHATLRQALRDGRLFRLEHRILRPDGTVRLVEELGLPERDAEGRIRRIVGSCQDVTERRMAEAALADNSERLRELLATLDLAAFMARDPDGTIRFWSAGCERLYGWSAAEALGRSAHDLLRTTFPVSREEVEAALAQDGEWTGELRQRRRDGEEVVVAAHKALRRDAAGRPVAVVENVADVTALREVQESLTESEARYRSLFERMEEGFALWEPIRDRAGAVLDFRLMERNDAMDRITGGAMPEASPGRTMRALFPDLAPHWFAAFARAAETGEPQMIEDEAPTIRRWLGARIYRPTPDRVAVLVRDTSERVAAEAALRASEAMLRRVLDNLFAFVAVLEPGGTLLYANHTPLDLAGITLEDVRGRPLWDAFWWSHDPAVAARVREACARAAAGEASRFDLEARAAGDSRLALDFQVAPLRDDAGRITHLIPSAVDITERKRSEEAKLLLAREVDHRAKNVLAVVQSVLALTRTADPEAFKRAVMGRIAAMARAHTLLAKERWQGADLRMLLTEELAAYLGEAGSEPAVRLDGPSAGLAPEATQPVAMATHELVTNAAKYGALSVPGGRVSVTWSRDPATDGLVLRWEERGGPPVAAPARRGFGTGLIENTVRRQLHGQLDLWWEPEGLCCEIRLPARLVAWRAPTR